MLRLICFIKTFPQNVSYYVITFKNYALIWKKYCRPNHSPSVSLVDALSEVPQLFLKFKFFLKCRNTSLIQLAWHVKVSFNVSRAGKFLQLFYTKSQIYLTPIMKHLFTDPTLNAILTIRAPHTKTRTTEQKTSGYTRTRNSLGRAVHVTLIGGTTSLARRALSHYWRVAALLLRLIPRRRGPAHGRSMLLASSWFVNKYTKLQLYFKTFPSKNPQLLNFN